MPSRRDARGLPALNQSTRSWTDHNGTNYTINSYTSPGISFGTMTGNSGGPFARGFSTSTAPRPAARGSMFGNAFSVLEDMIAMQQQQRAAFESSAPHQSRKPRTQDLNAEVDSETEGEDDGLAYGQYDNNRRKSVFSRIKERLLDGKRSPRKEDGNLSSREISPAPSLKAGRRESAYYRPSTREPVPSQQHARPSPVQIVVEHEEDDSDEVYSNAHSKGCPAADSASIDALDEAVENERRAVRSCKRRLEEASRQSSVTSSLLQRVIDEMRRHESALAAAIEHRDKQKAEDRRRFGIPPTPTRTRSTRSRPQTYHPRQSQQRQSRPSLEGPFFPTFAGFGFEPPSPHSIHRDAHMNAHMQAHRNGMFDAYEQLNAFNQFGRPQSFGAFEHLFGTMPSIPDDPPFHTFETFGPQRHDSQRKRTRYSQGPPPAHRQSHQFPTCTPPATPPSPQPPPTLMRPAEAQKLFKAYNERWNSLPATDPAIPYPARGLQASSLSARDSIWAPRMNADVSTWNEETVMQANAHAFYLGVVGLKPRYTETPGTGQIECGFDTASASPEQIKQLVDMLKKEKPRWHSDRLGRRNGGIMGGMPNEILQKDVRARAVFHAVCELMDRALE